MLGPVLDFRGLREVDSITVCPLLPIQDVCHRTPTQKTDISMAAHVPTMDGAKPSAALPVITAAILAPEDP
jgi:hypothetical protein